MITMDPTAYGLYWPLI